MKEKLDWIIRYTSNNTVCESCGRSEVYYVDYICNASTDGLEENYKHPEIRLIIDLGPDEIMRVLNMIGCMVRDGKRFRPGDKISGIYTDCDLRVDWIDEEDEAYPALRIVIPDAENRYPEDEQCGEVYKLQKYKLKDLRVM